MFLLTTYIYLHPTCACTGLAVCMSRKHMTRVLLVACYTTAKINTVGSQHANNRPWWWGYSYYLSLQIHLRGGTVIPMQKPGNTTTESRKNNYTLLVVLDGIGEARGDLFLDDGLSIDIKRWAWESFTFSFSCTTQVLPIICTSRGIRLLHYHTPYIVYLIWLTSHLMYNW